MRLLKNFFINVRIVYPICGYLLLIATMVLFKIKPYEYNLSALIGIWKGFALLNQDLMDKGFVVFTDGGYDGQFFYLIGKSIYTQGFENFPMLDSFFLRFNRLGLPILSGLISKIIGFNFYAIITLCVLCFFHIYSFILLYNSFNSQYKYLAYFHLFSPFTINANLLLLSDSLFVSFSILCICFGTELGINPFNLSQIATKETKTKILFFFILLTFNCFIREAGIILSASLFLFCIYEKKFRLSFPILFSIIFYVLVTQFFKRIEGINPGTNPLGFLELIDYPLSGFYKSIQVTSIIDLKSLFRELAKFPVFFFFLLLLMTLKNIKSLGDLILYLPLFFTIFTVSVGEQGYWLSFDNISRMFSITVPWILFFKNRSNAYNDYYTLNISFLILILIVFRIIYLKPIMNYSIF